MGELALVLFWPALAGYTEAAVAYAGDTLRPGRLVRWAIWGVRLGWLAQTALLVAQAVDADGFPWGRWAGSLNLFVWMCVGAYLIWGCRAPFRLLGLAVMPLAAVLLVLAWAAGGAGEPARSEFGDAFLALHVGLVARRLRRLHASPRRSPLLYLWQERRLKRRTPSVLRLRAPSLETLDSLDRADDRGRAARAHARHRHRVRAVSGPRAAGSTRRWRSRSSPGSSTPRSSSCATRPAGAAAAPPTSPSPASPSSSLVRLALTPFGHF